MSFPLALFAATAAEYRHDQFGGLIPSQQAWVSGGQPEGNKREGLGSLEDERVEQLEPEEAEAKRLAPGAGNRRGYTMNTQPYTYVDPVTNSPKAPTGDYEDLIKAAKGVQQQGLVVMTAGDWDYREMLLNWMSYVRKLKWTNGLVLCLDDPTYKLVRRQKYTSCAGRACVDVGAVNNTANMRGWGPSRLQRHIQAAKMEKHVAAAALVKAGLSVLVTDASAVVLSDILPMLRELPADVDIAAQRDDFPLSDTQKVGVAANTGFVFLRGDDDANLGRRRVAAFVGAAVERGISEFYRRWNNLVDQYGYNHIVQDSAAPPPVGLAEWTGERVNSTSVVNLAAQDAFGQINFAFLPFDVFPKHGPWEQLNATAAIYHGPDLHGIGYTGRARGNRLRLDRYDEEDFATHARALESIGLWDVPSATKYMADMEA